VTGQVLASVVQQQNRVYQTGAPGEQVTLLAYGYQYVNGHQETYESDQRAG
jgi:hypothetical protein